MILTFTSRLRRVLFVTIIAGAGALCAVAARAEEPPAAVAAPPQTPTPVAAPPQVTPAPPMTPVAPVAAPVADPASADVDAVLEQADRRYKVGDLVTALAAYKLVYLKRADPSLLRRIGDCHREMREPELALREYRIYLTERPDAPDRAAVEALIATQEGMLRQVTDDELPRRSSPPPAPARAPSRLPWILGGVAVTVTAGVVLGVAVSIPVDGHVDPGTDGYYGVTFK